MADNNHDTPESQIEGSEAAAWKLVQPSQAAEHEAEPSLLEGTGGDGAKIDPSEESDLWEGRTKWQHFIPSLMVGMLAIIVVIWISLSLKGWRNWSASSVFMFDFIATTVIGLTVIGRLVWTIFSSRYRLTTQRLFVERGLISQTIDQTELIRVDDVRIHKTFLDRVFGPGSIEVMSTDATDRGLKIVGVADPDKIAEAIRVHMRTLRKRSLFVENI